MKVLVAHASKRGSTAEIAQAIAETLRQSGLSVDCKDAGEVGTLADYDAVVLGSAVYIKRWRGDAKQFLRKHASALVQPRSGCSAPVPSARQRRTMLRRNEASRSRSGPGHAWRRQPESFGHGCRARKAAHADRSP